MMSESSVEELRALRRRAYGPAADIHADPEALKRLTQLENPEASSAAASTLPDETDPNSSEPSHSEDASHSSPFDQPSTSPPVAHHRFRYRPSRLTVLVASAVAMLAAVAIVTLTVVQRVQTDPLQVGASQIARLSVDPGFQPPSALNNADSASLVGYQDFYGLRPVVSEPSDGVTGRLPGTYGSGATSDCMTIYQPEKFEATGDGYSYSGGVFLTGCAAGAFPATATFTVPDDSPKELREAFPVGTALQFVHDSKNNEIVVFRG
jgi:hypothetical protein